MSHEETASKCRSVAAACQSWSPSCRSGDDMQAHSDAPDERLTVRLQWAAPQPIRRCAAILQRWRTAPREIIVAAGFFSRQTLCTCQLILKPLFQLEIFIWHRRTRWCPGAASWSVVFYFFIFGGGCTPLGCPPSPSKSWSWSLG